MKNILLIGGCGSGKTWVMLELIKKFNLDIQAKFGMVGVRRNVHLNLLVLGVYDGQTFQGSDRLSMAVMRDVPEFIKNYEHKGAGFCVCEGDRFTNQNYIKLARPIVIKIIDDGSKGRKLRGSSQTERQIKTIATRVRNIVADVEVKDSNAALGKILKLVGYGKGKR